MRPAGPSRRGPLAGARPLPPDLAGAARSGASARPGARGDPLVGVSRLLVDATNLLHALRRGAPQPPAALIGRLRAVIPAAVVIELVFDGPPEPWSRGRIAGGLTVRYGGTRSADAVLLGLVEAAGPPAPGSDPAILVVSDDAELRRALRERGAATARAAWLIGRLERSSLASPSVGRRRPPAGSSAPDRDGTEERPGWHPGRGATVKRGNARRAPKRGRPASDA